ncbi:excalibur calcium-binding domain-containing protein [Streptomyces sp. NPDC102476]|uniref:excalibur calcium-binding domain-containing protein n=1 Tax=Streptomyces sp. NPDC102476 TaxID=3366181 RepID=UPI00380F50F3
MADGDDGLGGVGVRDVDFVGVGGYAPEPTTAPVPYYENCDEARAAGDAPLYRGDPGYAGP